MSNRWIFIILAGLLFVGQAFAADGSGVHIMTTAPGGIVTVERVIDDSKVLLSVSNPARDPILGLTISDFAVTMGEKTGKIISVTPVAENQDVPRNIVLVLDNSDSMRQRNAIEPLKAGVDELLKIVRPIDKVQIVTFRKKGKMNFGGRDIEVQTFTSNQQAELKNFVATAYGNGITSRTVLYDAMLVGIDLIRTMPSDEPRFMVIFSDGQDLNSEYKEKDVFKAMGGVGRFHAYGIDFMPGREKDKFLMEFAERNDGHLWKATSETNLVSIFQSVASKMQYYYVVSYLFPTTGSLRVAPASLTIDDIENFDASAPRGGSAGMVRHIDTSELTLSPMVDTVYGIAHWKAVVSNTGGIIAVQTGEGAPAAEIKVPIKTDDLAKLVAGGDISVNMEVQDSKGQSIVLTALPVKVNHSRTTGSLRVAPASLTIDDMENFDATAPGGGSAGMVRHIDTSELTLSPMVDTVYGIAHWKAVISNTGGVIAVQTGEGTPAAEIRVPIKTDDLAKLVAGGDINVNMEAQDRKGQTLLLTALPVKVNHSRTTGSLRVAPASLTIDDMENFDATAPGGGSAGMVRHIDTSELTLSPMVDTVYGIAHWKAVISNTGGVIAVQTGEGTPAAEIKVPIKTDDLAKLVAGGDISVNMEVQDSKGRTLVLTALPVKVNHFRTTGSITVVPASLTIEEIKTIDASPMLGHVYFEEGSSDIPARYVRLSGIEETAAFDEQRLRETLEKYYQVLNIIGKRLTARPEAAVTIVGCNSDTGLEKNNKKLSAGRAQAVMDYLQTVWKIAPWRMHSEVRNLPAKPSTSSLKEGQAENRRVEIHSTDLEVLAPVLSVYMTSQIDAPALKLHPEVVSPHGIASWKITASNAAGILTTLEGKGSPAAETDMPMDIGKLEALAIGGDIAVKMELRDINGQIITLSPAPIKVNFLRTSQRLAQKQDQRVREKYALILFDFDKDTIEEGNQAIVNRIVARIHELPQAAVDIVGHTDNIGKEAYNIKLSERRALAVYKLLTAAYAETPGESIHQRGVGPNVPLYDNLSPEARSFNRTVTITLEYMVSN